MLLPSNEALNPKPYTISFKWTFKTHAHFGQKCRRLKMALALPGPSFSFIFFHLLSFLFSFFHFFSFSFIFSFSDIFCHALSCSFIFSFIFCRGLKICSFGLNFVAIDLDSVYVQNQFWGPSREVPLWALFSFFSSLFFLPFFSCCFWYFSFFFIFHFSFFLNFFILFF